MSRPALLDKLFQAGKTLFKPALIPVDNTTIKAVNNQLAVQKATATTIGGVKITGEDGLVMQSDGSAAVDFDAMPTDKFEAMLKSIRVPIWLEANKAFYVNGTTGSDTLDSGRGESASKPFQTIQACIDYVTSNYNINVYNLTIVIEEGEYNERIQLRDFTSSGGRIIISGKSTSNYFTLLGGIEAPYGGSYTIQNINFNTSPNFENNGSISHIRSASSSSNIMIRYCNFNNINTDNEIQKNSIWITAGTISVYESCEFYGNYTTFWLVQQGGILNLSRDTNVNDITTNIFLGINEAKFSRFGPSNGSLSVISGNAIGKRYEASLNATINTRGGGPNFFPGTIDGTVSTGAQYA